MAKQRKARPGSQRGTRRDVSSADLWGASAIGILIACVALLVHFLDDDLVDLFGHDDRTFIDRVAQAMGMASVALGLLGLWRKEVEVLCGTTILFGAVAIFFEFFLFIAIVAILIAVSVALFRTFFRR